MRETKSGRRFGLGLLATLAFSAASFGLVSLAPVGAFAQTAAPKPAPAPALVALAKELVAANGEAQAFEGVIPSIVEGAARSFLSTNPDLVKPLGEVAQEILPQFMKRKAEITDILATTYAQHFSEAELKEALAFYKTPTGKKLVTERPIIVQEAVQGIQLWGAQLNGLAVDAVREAMKKKGFDL